MPSVATKDWRLSPDVRKRVQDLCAKHDATRNSAGELRRGFKEVDDPRQVPGAVVGSNLSISFPAWEPADLLTTPGQAQERNLHRT